MALSDLTLPTTVINNYLWDTMKKIELKLHKRLN